MKYDIDSTNSNIFIGREGKLYINFSIVVNHKNIIRKEGVMSQRKAITKEIVKIIVFLFLTLALMCIMQRESYAIGSYFDYTVNYVDESGNVIKSESGSRLGGIGLSTEIFTIPVQPTFTEGGITYYVKSSVDQNLPSDVTLSSSNDLLTVTLNWVTYTGGVTYNLVCRDNRYPYVIKYEDESGNTLINDQTGRAPDMTWLSLDNTEFTATLYDAGVVYVVNPVQVYSAYMYQYNSANDIKVLVGANYPLYKIVCTRKNPSGSGTTPGGSGTTPGGSGTTPGGSGTTPGGSGTTPGGSGTTPGGSGTTPGGSGTTPSESGTTPGGSGTTPGGSGTAPGGSGTTPGGSGTTPGGSGTTPGGSGTTPGGSGTTPGGSGTTPGGSGTTPGGSGTTPGRSGTTTPGVVVIPGRTVGSGSTVGSSGTGKVERSHNSGSGRGIGHKAIGKGSSGIGSPLKQGWILENNNWYYYSGTTRDTLKRGWHLDPQDGKWYYLNPLDGVMFIGWHNIGEKWYFFNNYTTNWTWELRNGEWYFKNIENSRPLGSMYTNEKTPDGFKVDKNGEYIR